MEYNKYEDILTHLGDDYEKFQGAIVPPIYQNSLFVLSNEENGIPEHPYAYTRVTNPTVEIPEKKVAALEGAENGLCFASGMAAITASILHFVTKDCHVITVKSTYGPTRKFLKDYLPRKFGVKTSFLSDEELEHIEDFITEETKLIYLESPSTAVFKVQDLAKIGKLARERGIGTVIDNSYATPLFQHPLSMGIDISVHTASKYLGGHSDIVAGVLVSSHEICQSILENERELIGANMDPHQAWLMLRGMRTLGVRLKQHQENAMTVATYLENHPKIERVFYPGLASHPQKELIDKQMTGFNGLLSVVPKGSAEDALKFMRSLKLFVNGCSWGGFESLAVNITAGKPKEHCEEIDCPANLIRLHVGLENVESLIADLEQALEKI